MQFPEIANAVHVDPYMIMADFDDYHRVHHELMEAYKDKKSWTRMSLMNTASAGVFAADRAIDEYAKNIWHASPVK